MKTHPHTPESHSTNEVGASELTTVEILWLEKRIENSVRFGRPVSEKVLDRNRRVLSYAPGSIFAFVRWTSNDFGTIYLASISCAPRYRDGAIRPSPGSRPGVRACCGYPAGRTSNGSCN
jgi:hypothetical protein